ncbi:MAG: glycosyltransferase family 9 protein [Pseudomonadota bacterium]
MNFIRRLNHARIDFGRALALNTARFIFDRKSRHPRLQDIDIQRILVLNIGDKIGDTTVCTLMYRELHRWNPDVKVDMVCGRQTFPLVENNPYIDDIIVCKKGFFATIFLAEKLRRKKYDVVFDVRELTDASTLYLLKRMAGKVNVGFDRNKYALHDILMDDGLKKIHVAERYGELLRVLGIENPNLAYDLHVSPQDRNEIAALLKQAAIDAQLIVINAYAAARYRNISLGRVGEIIAALQRSVWRNYSVVLVGPPAKRAELRQFVDKSRADKLYYFPEISSIMRVAALIGRARLVITPDTSIVHIASAFDTPQICFYRHDGADDLQNAIRWGPRSRQHQVIYARARTHGEVDINTFRIEDVQRALDKLVEEM